MTNDFTPQQISADALNAINSNFSGLQEEIETKADLNGDSTQKFKVADAVESTDAVNKGQLDSAVSTLNSTISNLETEMDTKLATKLDVSDTTVTKQGNTFNGAGQLVKLNSNGQLPAVDGSLLIGLPHIVAANTTLYVATTGSDTTGDGSNSAPYATIQKALDYLNGKTLLGTVVIQVADGTYSDGFTVNHPQSNLIYVLGNATTPSNCVINVTGENTAISVEQNNSLTINGFKILGDRTANSKGIMCVFNSSIDLGSLIIIDGFDINLYICLNSSVYGHEGIILQNAITANLECNALSYALMPSCSFLGNAITKTNYGICCSVKSFVYIAGSTITNSTIGSGAYNCSLIGQANTITTIYTNCTTNLSPAFNTLGNNNSYIANC